MAKVSMDAEQFAKLHEYGFFVSSLVETKNSTLKAQLEADVHRFRTDFDRVGVPAEIIKKSVELASARKEHLVSEVLTRLKQEKEILMPDPDKQEILNAIEALSLEVKEISTSIGKTANSPMPVTPSKTWKAVFGTLVTIVVLVGVIGLSAWVFEKWLEPRTQVSIDFSIGEIIGGLLVGLGALIAGLKYAPKPPN
jgi:hypothetical protein